MGQSLGPCCADTKAPQTVDGNVSSKPSASSILANKGLKIGDLVEVKTRVGLRKGVVKYCGPLKTHTHEWVGLELTTPDGHNNGSLDGSKYFVCTQGFGLFTAPENVRATTCSVSAQPAVVITSAADERRSSSVSEGAIIVTNLASDSARSTVNTANSSLVIRSASGSTASLLGSNSTGATSSGSYNKAASEVEPVVKTQLAPVSLMGKETVSNSIIISGSNSGPNNSIDHAAPKKVQLPPESQSQPTSTLNKAPSKKSLVHVPTSSGAVDVAVVPMGRTATLTALRDNRTRDASLSISSDTVARLRKESVLRVWDHWPIMAQSAGSCVVCSTVGQFQCKECGIYLCADPCMEAFHNAIIEDMDSSKDLVVGTPLVVT